MYISSFMYNHWSLLCIPLYFLWLPIFLCFIIGVPSVVVWLLLIIICFCSLLQAINIVHALNEGNKTQAIKMFLLQILGILVAVSPTLLNIDYTISYLVQHNIFASYP